MQTPRDSFAAQDTSEQAPAVTTNPPDDARPPHAPVALEPYWVELCDWATD